ncbi:hypothetical protein DRO69_09200 [Candidatus Bathyarchaeota archaeon]|nr:MAG: hypothetical protein DRO69_09200 [Candidatus Bathyarchaeota archaeon]
MRRLLRLGVLGLGKMGVLHLRNSRHLPNARVISVADASKRALKRARKFGIKETYLDYRDLLERSDVDAVIITLPNFLHKESIFATAETGRHIFVEKPLALSSKDCRDIRLKVESCGVHLMVGHNYRFFECVQKVKKLYDEGVVGDVEIATLELVLNGPFAPSVRPVPVSEWYFDKEKLGMGCLDSGVHLIDLFQWFFGAPSVLFASLGYRFNLPYEDSVVAVLQSKTHKTRGVINVGWFSKMIFPRFDFRIILHGTNGFISTDHFVPQNLYLHAMKEASKNLVRRLLGGRLHPLTYTYYYASYYEEIRHFCKAIEEDRKPEVGAKDAETIANTIEQIYRIAQVQANHLKE